MLESGVGFSVSFTRQWAGIGSGVSRLAAAGGWLPRAGGGAGCATGVVNRPAGVTAADMTIVCALDIERIASQFVEVLAASKSATTSMVSSLRSYIRRQADG